MFSVRTFLAGEIRDAVLNAGFAWFDQGKYNLNLVGVRSAEASANTFNDKLYCIFNSGSGSCSFEFVFTADPGTHWRLNPMNDLGVAVLPRGQHRGLFKLGKHQGKYDALVQRREVAVLRDNNLDDVINFDGVLDTGWHGINLHRAVEVGVSEVVGQWSAGCQVVASSLDFDLLLSVCKKAASIWGNAFTYTLLDERDVDNVLL